MSFRLSLLAAAGALAVASAPAYAYSTNFAPYVGDSTPLAIPSGDNTLTFSSPTDPGTFQVGSTTGLFSFPVALGDFTSFGGDTLDITFAHAVTSFDINFGIEDAFGLSGSETLAFTTSAGQSGSFGTSLDDLILQEPEGVGQFVGTPFTSLTLTSVNPFAIASISVPEPMSIAALSVGLFGLAATRRRRQ